MYTIDTNNFLLVLLELRALLYNTVVLVLLMSDGNCRGNSTFIGYFDFKFARIKVSIVKSNGMLIMELWKAASFSFSGLEQYHVSKNTEPKICKAKDFVSW